MGHHFEFMERQLGPWRPEVDRHGQLPSLTWHLMALVHSAPTSAAVAGKYAQIKTFPKGNES